MTQFFSFNEAAARMNDTTQTMTGDQMTAQTMMGATNSSRKVGMVEAMERMIANSNISEDDKRDMLLGVHELKNQHLNVLFVGGTGVGKSSTINALFDTEVAKVGVGVDPETMTIDRYDMDHMTIWDSPGLGDGVEKDRQHSQRLIDKLMERDGKGDLLIDLVVVILDGASKDMGTSYRLINDVVIQTLKDADGKTDRLLIAVNQADMAMKGRHWNFEENRPEAKLTEFLNTKMASIQRRVKEATEVDINPMYYCAGYTDGEAEQKPWNLSKLLCFIVQHAPSGKRVFLAGNINRAPDIYKHDDELEDYIVEIQKSLWDSVRETASKYSDIGENIGSVFGGTGRAIGKVVGGVVGGVVGFIEGLFG
jgi:predicted GTPase